MWSQKRSELFWRVIELAVASGWRTTWEEVSSVPATESKSESLNPDRQMLTRRGIEQEQVPICL